MSHAATLCAVGQDGTAPTPAKRRPAPRTRRTAHAPLRRATRGAPEKRRSLLRPLRVFACSCSFLSVTGLGRRQKPASLGFLAHGGPGERRETRCHGASESLRHCEANERANAPDAGRSSCCRIGESTGLFKRWGVRSIGHRTRAGSCTRASSHTGRRGAGEFRSSQCKKRV